MSCHVPFALGVFGEDAQPSPGFADEGAVYNIADRLFPEAPASGVLFVAGWLANALRISELGRFRLDERVFDVLLRVLAQPAVLAPHPVALPPRATPVPSPRLVAAEPAALADWSHVPLLPSVFREPVEFARFASPAVAADAAGACGGFVGSEACVAAMPRRTLRQALSTQLFDLRRATPVSHAFPLTPVVAWFLQHGEEDTRALAEYVAGCFALPGPGWGRSSRGDTRADWRWFTAMLTRAQDAYPELDEEDAWRMLGLFLLAPPPPTPDVVQKPLFYLDARAAHVPRVMMRLERMGDDSDTEGAQGSPTGDEAKHTPVARADEEALWRVVMDDTRQDVAFVALAGLHRKRHQAKSVPDRLNIPMAWLPADCRLFDGVRCRHRNRHDIEPTPEQRAVCAIDYTAEEKRKARYDPEEIARYVAIGQACDLSCRAARDARILGGRAPQNMPRVKPRSRAFNRSTTPRALEQQDIYAAAAAPAQALPPDTDAFCFPDLLWRALLRNECAALGLPDADIRPPLATWKNQFTGVCFRGDATPALPLWAGVDGATVTLADVAPAVPEGTGAPALPPMYIQPLQGKRLCICRVHSEDDFDPRRGAGAMAAGNDAREYERRGIEAVDAFRLAHGGALPKPRDVQVPFAPPGALSSSTGASPRTSLR